MFVPGLLCTADLFAHQLEHLRQDFSLSLADTRSDVSLADMAERALASAPNRFALVGQSMAGYVAVEIMARAPERVTRLVLIDTSARADREEQKEVRRQSVDLARREGIRAANGAIYDRIVGASNRTDAGLKARIDRMADEIGVDTYARQQQAIMDRRDVREELSAIEIPVLVIVGTEDELTPPKLAHEMVSRLPNARLEEIPSCGHMSTMERPDAVTALIADFLKAQLDAGPKT